MDKRNALPWVAARWLEETEGKTGNTQPLAELEEIERLETELGVTVIGNTLPERMSAIASKMLADDRKATGRRGSQLDGIILPDALGDRRERELSEGLIGDPEVPTQGYVSPRPTKAAFESEKRREAKRDRQRRDAGIHL